jgi:hypothetical protein
MVRRSMKQEQLPEKVYVVGILRDPAVYHTPVRDEQSGLGVAPLTVLDADGERALLVFTTLPKTQRGIRHFITDQNRASNPMGMALCGLDELLRTTAEAPEEVPKLDYIGIDMGEGGIYPLIRL